MLANYFKKFKEIPPDVRTAVGSDVAVRTLEALEGKYGVKLARLAVRVLSREFPLDRLPEVASGELALDRVKAAALADDLVKTFLAPVLSYLVGTLPSHADPPIGGEASPQKSAGILHSVQNDYQRSQDDIVEKAPPPPRQDFASQNLGGQAHPPRRPPQILKRPKAAFYFDVEDERELEGFRERAHTDEMERANFRSGLDRMVEGIIEKCGVSFPQDEGGEVLRNRFANVISLRLRDVRDQLETKEMFSRGQDKGGMGFDPVTIERVIALVEEVVKKVHTGERFIMTPSHEPSLEEARLPAGRQGLPSPAGEVFGGQVYTPFVPTAPAPIPSLPRPTLSISSHVAREEERPKIRDVKARLPDGQGVARLIGPVEELATFSLADFRNLAPTPSEASAKIREKFALLREEGEDQFARGVKGWRTSPLTRSYLTQGIEALSTQMKLYSAMEARKGRGEEYLSEDEFQAIANLNASLRL